MTSLLWFPILLSIICLVLMYLVKDIPSKMGMRRSMKDRLEKRIEVSKQLKKSVLFLIGLIFVYSLSYSVYSSFTLLESALEGNDIIKPELKNVEIDEGKAQNLLNIMLISYLALSTFFAGGFIRSMIKTIVGLMKNRKLSARNVEQR
ncbi:hypothetical protein [Mammaliicoccus sciuri]|uniref:hypothetical protein n=1 Tax=Mammaliicoccus sciuri TaxID=1296 RepID=UPI00114F6217|nr:hypothetical protein [Mammaliicoccus sciuri]